MGYADVLAGLAGPKQVAGAATKPLGLPPGWIPSGGAGKADQTQFNYGGVDSGPAQTYNFNTNALNAPADFYASIGFTPPSGAPGRGLTVPNGSGENFVGLESTGLFEQYMQSKGLTMAQLLGQGDTNTYGAFDSSGKQVGNTFQQKQDDDAFGIVVAALGLAGGAGIASGALAGGAAGAGAGASSAAAGAVADGGADIGAISEAGMSGGGDLVSAVGTTGAGGAASGGGSVADLSSVLYSDYAPVSGAGVGGAGTSITGSTGAVGAAGETMGAGAASGGSSGLFGTGASGMQLGQLASSLYGMYQGNQIKGAASASDPFAKYRGEYGAQLEALMKDPSSVTSLPGYQASQKAAEQALTRNLASQGLTGSGTAAEALATEGAKFEDKYYQETIATLSGLAGAGINNAGISLAGQAAGDNTINQSINNLVKIWGASGGSGGGGSDWGSLISSFFGG